MTDLRKRAGENCLCETQGHTGCEPGTCWADSLGACDRCPECGGDGGWVMGMDDYWEVCPACNGTGLLPEEGS